MTHIFISYSRKDSEYVDSLVESLSQENFHIWLDRKDIQAGQNWRAEIVEAIETADSFVLVFSQSAALSKYVRQEVYVADSSDRAISTLYMESLELPSELKLPLAGLQIILLFEDWNAGYYKLVEMLREQQLAEQEKIKPALPATRRAELSIEPAKIVDTEERKNKLLNLLSGILGFNLNPSQIVKLAADKIVIDIPYHLSYELKAQALNNNPALWEAGINGLSFEEDKHNIPLQDPKLFTASQEGRVPQPEARPSSRPSPKPKPKISRFIWWLALPLVCMIVLCGLFFFAPWDFSTPPASVPSTITIPPGAPITDPPTQTPVRETPIITDTPALARPLTSSPTATKTSTINVTPSGNISGFIWEDTNADGVFTPTEGVGAPGFIVSLGEGSCNSVGFSTEQTNSAGNFSFDNLPAGTYCVSISPTPICDTFSTASNATANTINLAPGVSEIVRFGLRKTECVD